MISDEAVEAAARAWIKSICATGAGSTEPPTETEKRAIRAALEAALPHLLASHEGRVRKLVYDHSVSVAPSSPSGPMIVGHEQFDALVKALVNHTKEV